MLVFFPNIFCQHSPRITPRSKTASSTDQILDLVPCHPRFQSEPDRINTRAGIPQAPPLTWPETTTTSTSTIGARPRSKQKRNSRSKTTTSRHLSDETTLLLL